MGVYLYPNNTETELKNAYIWIPNPTSIVLDKSVISLTTVWQTEQLTATIEPTVSDKTITWSSDDTAVATVDTTWLVTCVTPWECTITATTVNGLTASCSVTHSRLPNTYQEVEYIESSWSQVIKSWVYITETWIRADIDFQITSSNPSDQAVIWFYNNENGSNSYRCGYWPNNWFTMSQWSESLNRQTATGNSISFTASSYQLYLFAKQRYTNWNYDSNAKAKVYSCQMYKWNTLVRDFIPCYRIADSVIWMYDAANGVFYTNDWSGTFTKWSDV